MDGFIAFVMGNFTLTFLVIGAVFSLAGIARSPRPLAAPVVVEKFFFWFLFFSIGCSFLYNGFFHAAMPQMAAELIGWANSPFQIELGFASIGFGLVGVIAPWKGIQMRFAAILPVASFLWGAAGVHIQSMIRAKCFTERCESSEYCSPRKCNMNPKCLWTNKKRPSDWQEDFGKTWRTEKVGYCKPKF